MESLKFIDLPIEIIERITGLCESPKVFFGLRLTSKLTKNIFRYVNYNKPIDYDKIKNMEDRPRFTNIVLKRYPKNMKKLFRMNPIELTVNFYKVRDNRRIFKIPGSVRILNAKRTNLYFDPIRNQNIQYLRLDRVTITGLIGNKLIELDLDRPDYMSEDFSGFDKLTQLRITKSVNLDMTAEYIFGCLEWLVEGMTNLKKLDLQISPTKNIKLCMVIPKLTGLVELRLRLLEKSRHIKVDLQNLETLKVLRVTTYGDIYIINKPPNLELYSLEVLGSPDNIILCNDGLNISAREVRITSTPTFYYNCSDRIEKLYLRNRALARLSNSVKLLDIETCIYFDLNDPKNVEDLSIISTNVVRLSNIGKIRNLYISTSNHLYPKIGIIEDLEYSRTDTEMLENVELHGMPIIDYIFGRLKNVHTECSDGNRLICVKYKKNVDKL